MDMFVYIGVEACSGEWEGVYVEGFGLEWTRGGIRIYRSSSWSSG